MKVRFFAAAAAAAGTSEVEVPLSALADDGGTLGALLEHLVSAHGAGRPGATQPGATGQGAGTGTLATAPSLQRVIARSSFLLNEVNARDMDHPLQDNDVVDILPPFAGG